MDTLESFKTVLQPWFMAVDLPERLQDVLYDKFKNDTFDAGSHFSLTELAGSESDEECSQEEAAHTDGRCNRGFALVANKNMRAMKDVWLVDHCCTFQLRKLRGQLERNPALCQRLQSILNLSHRDGTAAEMAQAIRENMWRYVSSYRLPIRDTDGADAQYDSCWFFHDEVGSAITIVVEEEPNMKLVPLPVCFQEKGYVVSVMWCVQDIEEGALTTRRASHACEGRSGHEVAQVLYGNHEEEAYGAAVRTCLGAWRRHIDSLTFIATANAGAGAAISPRQATYSTHDRDRPLTFYTDSNLVATFVTDTTHFRMVDNPDAADVIWVAHYVMHYSSEFPHAQFVSQFPEERLFTNKQGLMRIVQKAIGCCPWFPISYDGTTELREFIGDYIVRRETISGHRAYATEEDVQKLLCDDHTNLWITKPVNLARSIDMGVSDHLSEVLKLVETGPKIVSKYIANTATLRRRKFDLRFIVALRSLRTEETELEVYVYDMFWTRFGLEDYSLSDFDVYEKHWTVMNYTNSERMIQMSCTDFIAAFDAEYAEKGFGEDVWSTHVYPKVLTMLKEVFSAIPPDSCSHERFRGMYGIDVMIRESAETKLLQPTLLEITYSPDCTRACEYKPSFFNDVFSTLFLGQPLNMTRV